MSQMKLRAKVQLKKKGQGAEIPIEGDVHARLRWNVPKDLDLHAFIRTKPGQSEVSSGFLGRKKETVNVPSEDIHLFFNSRRKYNNKTGFPWAFLTEDEGIGDSFGGDTEKDENMFFYGLKEHHEYVLIVANIYGENGHRFSDYGATVTILDMAGSELIDVPLDSDIAGSYAIVAYIDNSGTKPMLYKVDTIQDEKPNFENFLSTFKRSLF
jgi:hypothetical protein